MIDSPRFWYMAWWSGWTLASVVLAHVVVVRPITRRLDAIAEEIRYRG